MKLLRETVRRRLILENKNQFETMKRSGRQVIEQAINDLEENKETVRHIYEAWKNANENSKKFVNLTAEIDELDELDDAMKTAQYERINIAVSIFKDYKIYRGPFGKSVPSNPKYRYYEANPTPVLKVGDFHGGFGSKKTHPSITGASTMRAANGLKTIKTIDKFIGQLKRKLKSRKDLQETIMKLSKKQLKNIIREAIDQNADQEEAAYAIIYAEAYVTKFNQYFGNAVHDRKFMTPQTMPPAILMMDATDNLEAILAAQMRGIRRKIASLPEIDSITKEAEQAAEADFRDNIYTCVEQMDILINRQTPVGMSAAEALGVFGEEGGGVPFKDTAVSDMRAITALMDNDKVLTMLDQLVEMLPELNVFYSR